MLAFFGQDVVDDVQQLAHFDLDVVLFAHLAHQGMGQRLAKLDRAAGELPQAAFIPGGWTTAGEEEMTTFIDDDGTDADMVYASLHGSAFRM